MRARLVVLLAVALPLVAGCFHVDPVREQPVAVYEIAALQTSAKEYRFELLDAVAYWRTDLSARAQAAVSYNATSPSGETYGSEPAPEFPFAHSLTVADPEVGVWNLTVRAEKLVDARLQILVPER